MWSSRSRLWYSKGMLIYNRRLFLRQSVEGRWYLVITINQFIGKVNALSGQLDMANKTSYIEDYRKFRIRPLQYHWKIHLAKYMWLHGRLPKRYQLMHQKVSLLVSIKFCNRRHLINLQYPSKYTSPLKIIWAIRGRHLKH